MFSTATRCGNCSGSKPRTNANSPANYSENNRRAIWRMQHQLAQRTQVMRKILRRRNSWAFTAQERFSQCMDLSQRIPAKMR